MLLEFKTSNYKSFKDEIVFSLVPAPKQKGLDYSILKKKVGKTTYRALSSSVIYGPNASGKTNIIGAIDTFKAIVLRGNIRNDTDNTANEASNMLELIPNSQLKEALPVSFSIKFVHEDMLIEYSFSADLGCFLDTSYKRKIISENLKIDNQNIFDRTDTVNLSDYFLKKYFLDSAPKSNQVIVDAVNKRLNDEELFLMNGFRTVFSPELVSIISDWLTNKLIVIYRADLVETKRGSESKRNKESGSIIVDGYINEAAKNFGINSNSIGYVYTKDSDEGRLCSMFGTEESGNAIPADLFESYGTIRFVNMFPILLGAFINGCVLLIDEFDASLHPIALMNIINIFHNDEINKNNSQLIFNTHNPIFLNSNLYRRDEIKFVERDDDTHFSTHYSLSDFGTSGAMGVRKNEDYMDNYFVNKYGAIKDIDFSEIFKEARGE